MFLSALLIFVSAEYVSSAKVPPHIIYILADDLGWNDVGYHGMTEIPTPNIDALAGDGIILNNFYVCHLCTPSRAALLTGLYPSRTGLQHMVIQDGESSGLPLDIEILPQKLAKLGYENHMFGKWHLGFHHHRFTPIFRGFDGFFGTWGSHIDYLDHKAVIFYNRSEVLGLPENFDKDRIYFDGVDLRENMKPAKHSGKYLTDLLTQKTVKLIKSHNVSKPLFVYVAHYSVHRGNYLRNITSIKKYTRHFDYIKDEHRKQFAGHLAALDRSVGLIFKSLYERNMLDNSIIVFSSDNGADVASRVRNYGSNFPLRGQKWTPWEGGVRSPAFIWSPLLNYTRGVSNQMMHITDWLPTLYSAAGGNVEELGDIDGVDMWQALSNSYQSPRDEMLLAMDTKWNFSAIRYKQYKLLVNTPRLFPFDIRDNNTRRDMLPSVNCRGHSIVQNALKHFYIQHGGKPASFTPNIMVDCGISSSETPCTKFNDLCLFDIENDPCEYTDLSGTLKEILNLMLEKLEGHRRKAVPALKKGPDFLANPALYGGRWSTWVNAL